MNKNFLDAFSALRGLILVIGLVKLNRFEFVCLVLKMAGFVFLGDCDINKRVKLNEVDFGYYAWIALLYRSHNLEI